MHLTRAGLPWVPQPPSPRPPLRAPAFYEHVSSRRCCGNSQNDDTRPAGYAKIYCCRHDLNTPTAYMCSSCRGPPACPKAGLNPTFRRTLLFQACPMFGGRAPLSGSPYALAHPAFRARPASRRAHPRSARVAEGCKITHLGRWRFRVARGGQFSKGRSGNPVKIHLYMVRYFAIRVLCWGNISKVAYLNLRDCTTAAEERGAPSTILNMKFPIY